MRLSVVLVVSLALVPGHGGSPAPVWAGPQAGNPLAGLAPLVGRWSIPESDSIVLSRPELRTLIVAENAWAAQGRVIHHRENFQPGDPAGAQLDGIVYWDPVQERIRFVAGTGYGGVFEGEYAVWNDGRIARTYDVYYPTPDAAPGDELGGRRRRYREVYAVVGTDSLHATLDWWKDGGWQPFRRGEYGLRRVAP